MAGLAKPDDGHICDGNRGHNAQDCPANGNHLIFPFVMGDAAAAATTLGKLKAILRDDHRLKDGTDYAITFKYGLYHLLCCTVWVDLISTEAERAGLPHFNTIHTYQ